MGEAVGAYGWWILGVLLLVGELALPGVYLLFLGIGAMVVGANALVGLDLSWQSQLLGFVVVSGVAALLGHRRYGQRAKAPSGEPLNDRTARLVGRRARVSEAIRDGRGRVAVEDGWWNAEGPDLPVGAGVVVTAAKGSVLIVSALDREGSPKP
ncbi:NfeD family protein [Aureimonas flava]|uniref:NfeD family protein n=1 Tax=Aureimonas flava TaxID=2320271 RepID=A0A3A1WIT9_9HYPH|nr:NfeD family protein [Aureimonas flava]RIY00894.1 NfeD family protein [Aureimonas flava]